MFVRAVLQRSLTIPPPATLSQPAARPGDTSSWHSTDRARLGGDGRAPSRSLDHPPAAGHSYAFDSSRLFPPTRALGARGPPSPVMPRPTGCGDSGQGSSSRALHGLVGRLSMNQDTSLRRGVARLRSGRRYRRHSAQSGAALARPPQLTTTAIYADVVGTEERISCDVCGERRQRAHCGIRVYHNQLVTKNGYASVRVCA